MMDTESGHAPTGQALVSDEAPAGLHPSGFDPSRSLALRDTIARTIRRELQDEHKDAYNPERGSRFYDVLVLGCAEVNYCDPEDAANQFAFLAADAIIRDITDAIATEARRAETLGSVHEGAGPQDIATKGQP